MGKNKKKFIDKKKSATFQLMARDSSDPIYYSDTAAGSDRVFVRVDNNPFPTGNFEDDPNSIFADAPADNDNIEEDGGGGLFSLPREATLPKDVRREILELGFPDDGYNYLVHLREIKSTGAGSAYFHNPKATLHQLPGDVKAYDASRVLVAELKSSDTVDNSVCSVAARTVSIRVQKVVDPDVVALLDDDFSRFGSDHEDLEEDFVVCANLPEVGEDVDTYSNKKLQLNLIDKSKVVNNAIGEYSSSNHLENEVDCCTVGKLRDFAADVGGDFVDEKLQSCRLLDEQFDLFERREYGTYDEDDECGDYMAEEDEFLADKLKHALNDHVIDDLEHDDKYEVPADLLQGNQKPKNKDLLDSAADVLRQCAEYAEKYENDDEGEDVVVVQECSDESEKWDCETIISTCLNLDNHPAKIEAPERARKKVAEFVSGAVNTSSHIISLRGKEKLPVEFLPHARKSVTDKVKDASGSKLEQQKRKRHCQESKEEKKERKAAVKEEKREARRMKKEMRSLYRCEVQRAQRVAAVTGPSSIHLI